MWAVSKNRSHSQGRKEGMKHLIYLGNSKKATEARGYKWSALEDR